MITTPTLLLNEEICRENIRAMAFKARRNNITLSPHFKTHQSHEIGTWFRNEGIEKITVSSLSMALYFAEDGWHDILVAFPVNILEIETINNLAGRIKLTLLVESVETVEFLAKNLNSGISFFIKVDLGYNRTGVNCKDIETISEILNSAKNAGLLTFCGFLGHAGQSYKSRSISELLNVHKDTVALLLKLKDHFNSAYNDLRLSVGDTPTASIAGDFSMIDEIRPGNFVFYDLTQSIIGSCSVDQIAVAMACPVVAIHQERNEIVIYGGSVHFSTDTIEDFQGNIIYGQVVENTGDGWGKPVEGAYLKKLSQEHGIIQMPANLIANYKPGDIIKVLPVHSCTTANLMKKYLTLDGRKINRL
jgi:D-serine deaminase-like pyridoxal phosphate-dependent protein